MKPTRVFSVLYYILFLVLFLSGLCSAGSSPLTVYDYDAASETGYFDLVISLDWEPEQGDKEGLLTNAFEQFAEDVFMMTEGKHKIRNLYVFSNGQEMNRADIQVKNEGGRSNAQAGGIFKKGGRILTFTHFSSGTPRTDSYIGHTMAHEFGHYAYALFDEYADNNGPRWSIWPSTPRSGDNPRPTIMNQHGTWQWFSTSDDYQTEDEQNTAQWRYYKSSAWDTLVRNPKDDKRPLIFRSGYKRVQYESFAAMEEAPVSLYKPSSGWDTDFNIIWMEEGEAVALVIDVSGSMGWYGGMEAAINSAKQFVDLMETGQQIAVVEFHSSASVAHPLTLIESQGDKEAVKSSIDNLSAGGGTNFTAALNTTQTILSRSEIDNLSRFVVFMSDGIASQPDTTWYQQSNVPIYTIGLGGDIQPSILTAIADETGGFYSESPTNTELAGVYAQVHSATASGNMVEVAYGEADISAGEEVTFVTTISEKDDSARFRATWDDETIELNLMTPSGAIITPSSLPLNVAYGSGENYAIYTVENPNQGDWTSILIGGDTRESVSHYVSSQSFLSIGVELSGGKYPEPVSIIASVNGPEPVVGASVSATVTTPSGEQKILDLYDDGYPPDMEADDGVYTGVMTGYSEDGAYDIAIHVSNIDETAAIDTSGALEAGEDAAPRSLSAFSRYSSKSIVISGTDEPLPSDPLNAQVIVPDNTPVWGAIEEDGAEMWYTFDAIEGEEYFIQTSSLLSWDTYEMATHVTLFEPDRSTVIESSAYYDGTNTSYIEWTAPATDAYLIKVAHGSPGTGSYAITVGSESVFTKEFDQEEPGADTGGGSSGGCWISTLSR